MFIRFTDKLSKKLKLGRISRIEKYPGPFLEWYAHLFSVQRTQYILVTKATSLYTVIMYGRGVVDDNIFLKQFFSFLREKMEEIEGRMIFERIIAPNSARITLSKTINKSVLGSINDMVNMSKFVVESEDMSPFDLSDFLNNTPFKFINYQSPLAAFKSMKLKKGTDA
jgi:hypothetical protein